MDTEVLITEEIQRPLNTEDAQSCCGQGRPSTVRIVCVAHEFGRKVDDAQCR